MTAVADMSDLGYGTDLACYDDLTDDLQETDPTTIASLAQDCYHRITTARGLIPDDPDYGIDVVDMLHKGITLQDLQQFAGQIETELDKDDRIAQATATVVCPDFVSLTITIEITPADASVSSFVLIVQVTDGAALLQAVRTLT